jgi:pimeloyl-ACP methyl ester carboxylesterase
MTSRAQRVIAGPRVGLALPPILRPASYRLAGIIQPTFVANGDNDEMMHTANSVLLAEKLPSSQLRIYADANHGFLYQYPELFADHVRAFLSY